MKKSHALRLSAVILSIAVMLSFVTIPASAEETIGASFIEGTASTEIMTPDMTEKVSAEIVLPERTVSPNDKVRLIVILEGDALLDNEEEVAAADSLGAFLASPKASNAKNTLDNIHDAAKADIENLVASSGSLDKPEFLYEYKTLLNGFAIETEYRFISDINALPNVKSVSVAKYYEAPAPIESDLPEDTGSIAMIGAPAYYAMEEFSDFAAPRALGAGSLIAIIDTGVQYTHIAFQSYDREYLSDYGARSIPDILEIINSGNLNAFPAGSYFDYLSDMTAYTITGGKIAFGYDYGCFDSNADPLMGEETDAVSTHGTHVAGIAAGLVIEYDDVNDEVLVLYSGIAPYAQLAAMKVADPMGRLYNYAIFAALEDCVTLGVDSINMSLGSNCGFTDPIDEYYDEIYDGDISFVEVYRKLTNAGITIANSAGNSATSLYEYNAGEIGYPNTENPDYGTIGSDSSYSDPLSVASVENFMYPVNVLYYNEDSFVAFSDNDEYPLSQSMTPDVPVDYAMCGLGKIADFYVGDTSVVTGKIAVIMRGEITFTEKIANAKAAGAIGVLICQNEINKGVPFGFLLSDLAPANALPCASADYDVFATLEKALPNGSLRYTTEYNFNWMNPGEFSEFSSWGPTPDLRLKPEVAAPGGNIYSSVLYDATDENLSFEHKFALMSGTSMAAPQVAGAMAVVRSWVEAHIGAYNYTVYRPKAPDNGINNEIAPDNFIKKTVKELGETVNNLLISTADPFAYINEDIDDIPGENLIQGRFVSPRVQGAGLIDVENAIYSPVILSTPDIDGSGPDTTRPVLNLGEDMGNTGSFNLSFIATNLFYDEPITYDVVIYPMRPEVYESEDISIYTGYDVLIEEPIEYGSITVKPGETKTVNVSYRLPRKARNLYKELYENGSYVEGYVRLIPVYEEEPIYSSPSLAAPQNGTVISEDYVGFDFNPEIEDLYRYLVGCCYPVDLVVPFLGFYGEWEEAPIFDTDNYGEDGFDSRIYNTVIDAFGAYASGSAVYGSVNIGGDYTYRLLGTNFWADYNNANYVADMNTKGWSSRDYIDYYNQLDYIAINPENPDAIVGIAGVNPALLRNVRNLNAKIVANGEVVYNENAEYCRKSFVNTDYMEYFNDAFWGYSFEREDGDYNFCEWYGTDSNGNILPNGTTATVTLTGYLDYFDFDMVKNDNNTWSFPVYIDRVAPEFDENSFKVELIDGEIYVKIKVSDDHMLSYAALYEIDYAEDGEYIVDQEFYFDGETSDELVFNITEYYEKWYEGRDIVLFFYAEDYARNGVNTNQFVFNKIEASEYAETVEIEVGDEIDLNDYDFGSPFVRRSWAARNSDIAKVTSRGILYGRGEGKTVVTGTLENGKVVTFTVIVTEPEIEIPDNVHDGITVSTYKGIDLGALIDTSDTNIKWTTSKSYVATVSPSGYVRTFGYTGIVTITAYFSDGSTEIFIINVVR